MLGSEELGSDEEAAGAGGAAAAGVPGQKKGKGGSKRPDREPLYDMDAMHEKLEDIGWTEQAAWEETQAITHEDPAQVGRVAGWLSSVG